MNEIRITQTAIGGGERWSAHTYPEGDVVVASCRDPFTDGARALIARGYPPEAVLMLVDKTSGLPGLTGVLGKVAKLMVDGRTRFAPFDGDRPRKAPRSAVVKR